MNTDGVDYIGGSLPIVISEMNQNDPVCVNITIVDDTICEYDESFLISLTSDDTCVNINQALCTGEVIIVDNDGKSRITITHHT